MSSISSPPPVPMCRFHQPVRIAYTDLFTSKDDAIVERRYPFQINPDINYCTEVLIPGILHFAHYKSILPQNEEILLKNSGAYLSMVFSLKNRSTYTCRDSGVFAALAHNQHTLVFIPGQDAIIRWEPEKYGEVFVINLTPDYFQRFLPQTHPFFPILQAAVKNNKPVAADAENLVITPRMLSLLYAILQCEHKGHYKRLFIKSKVIELLMLQLEQYEQEPAAGIPEELGEANIKKMHMAREIIASNLARPCSIIDLAQQVGTNDCYLKKNFKQVFGTTIYGYLQKERMEKSKALILSGNKKIAEVARIAGYKHASHFTAAFKKYFGYSPNKIRLGILSLFYDFASLPLGEIPLL